jgi:hypothetical protein
MRATRVGSVNERFYKRFERDRKTGCWNWTGAVNAKGYGIIAGEINGKRYAPVGQNMLAHRVSWIIHKGDIPEVDSAHGMVVMHTCDNPGCVNPDHLILGAQSDNVRDMDKKGRHVVSGWHKRTGIEHFRSSITRQEDLDLILSTTGNTKDLAEKFGVHVSTIMRIRRRNGVVSADPNKFKNKPLSQEAIDYIRSTPPGTRGLAKKFGVGKTTISNIRQGLTHAR